MIYFEESPVIYSKILHNFLKEVVFNGFTKLDHIIDQTPMPDYLKREQFVKCRETYVDLYRWSGDSFLHELKAFHTVVLFGFIQLLKSFNKTVKKQLFKKAFDSEIKFLIRKQAAENHAEIVLDDPSCTIEDCEEFFYDLNYYENIIDCDFTFLDKLYNEYFEGKDFLQYFFGINLDFYFEILPLDIQNSYNTKHLYLSGEINEFLEFTKKNLEHGTLNQLFWDGSKHCNEKKVQIIFENLMKAYFANKDVDISREVILGNGAVDFKLFRNFKKQENVLIEIKMASSSSLKNGYQKQLTEYFMSSNYTSAFYFIVCFTNDEIKKAVNFIKTTFIPMKYNF